MTGYGQAVTETEMLTCKAEIKSLNNKFLELNVRMPRQWLQKETELRKVAAKIIERGTAVINIGLQYKQITQIASPLNYDVASYYLHQISHLADEHRFKVNHLFRSVFEFPNIITPTEENTDENEWNIIMQTLSNAAEAFTAYRLEEGNVLTKELTQYCNNIAAKLTQLELYEPARIELVKQKLNKEINQLQTDNIDKNRFEQELIYYIEKMDISEEKSRLHQHCKYFLQTLAEVSSGKKLGFIAQEMGREINTIGSKSYDAAMQRLVVEMKDELEKIKEQVNNIL